MTATELIQFWNFSKSAAIHLTLFALLAFFLFWKAPTPSRELPIEIQYPKTKSKAHESPLTGSSPHTRSAPRSSRPRVSLSDLGVKMDYHSAPEPQTDPSKTFQESNLVPSMPGGWDLMNPDPKIARFNQYVFNVVQHQLDLESQWIRNRLTGTVKIRLWFDENGRYLESSTGFEAIDPDFQKIVARALHNAFDRPIPKPYLYSDRRFFIDREVYIRQI